VRLEQLELDGRVAQVTLALEVADATGELGARMADLYIEASGGMALDKVTPGDSVTSSGKELHRFAQTDRNFHQQLDGSFRIMVLSTNSVDSLAAGRLAELRFSRAVNADTGHEPVSFRLLRKGITLAPAKANTLLEATSFDQPVVVRGGE
jgi:hypothetical protein